MISFGVTQLATVPLRKLPSENSEMISQLLFGETVKILKVKDKGWSLVECEFDGYLGWVSSNQITEIKEEE